MDKENALQKRRGDEETQIKLLEQLYVHDVYEKIATDFEHQHYQPCPSVGEFLLGLDPGSLVADIGCGNGHYLDVNPSIVVMGIDRSNNLLRCANHKTPGMTCRADCLSVPFIGQSFDAVLFIGVIHHLVTPKRQIRALQEVSRILRRRGVALLHAWAWEQETRKFKGQNLLVPRHASADCPSTSSCNCCHELTANENADESATSKLGHLLTTPKILISKLWRRSSLGSCEESSSTDSLQSSDGDEGRTSELYDSVIEVPKEFQVREFPASSLFSASKSTSEGETRLHSRRCLVHAGMLQPQTRDDRFYHVFKKGEIRNLISKHVPSLAIEQEVYNSGHWCIIVRKIF